MFGSPRTLQPLDSTVSVEIPKLKFNEKIISRSHSALARQKSVEDDTIHWFPPSRYGVYNEHTAKKVHTDSSRLAFTSVIRCIST